jgi:hypothetical protein
LVHAIWAKSGPTIDLPKSSASTSVPVIANPGCAACGCQPLRHESHRAELNTAELTFQPSAKPMITTAVNAARFGNGECVLNNLGDLESAPARAIIVASSEQHSAPVIVSNPASAQASNNQPGAPLNRDDSAETMKMPDPIIEPMTIMVASIGPSARTRLVVSLGNGPPSRRTGPAVRRAGAPAPLSILLLTANSSPR